MKIKRTKYSGLIAFVCSIVLWFNVSVFAESAKFEPPEGKILFFAGQNILAIDEYVKTIGIIPAGIMSYTSIQNADSLTEAVDNGAGENWAQYTLAKYPNTAWQVGLYMVDALDDIIGGEYDENIARLADFIKQIKRPVFLRIGYEFDGPHNNYDPEKYQQAFRYIVDKFRGYGITNVAYVWHSNAIPLDRPLTDWYPGDDYVDWFAISYFNQREDSMLPMVALAKEHKKPMMIGEASPAAIYTVPGKKAWFARYFEFINKNGVKAFCYINLDWNNYPLFKELNWGDARLDRSIIIKNSWTREIVKEQYVHSSKKLFDIIQFKEQ